MKPFLIAALFLLTSCQIQVNLASNVTNVPVIKAQVDSEGSEMTGSSLEDIKKGPDKAGDVSVPIP